MKRVFLILTVCLTPILATSQDFKNAFRFSAEMTTRREGYRQSQREIVRYSISYGRFIGNKAWMLEGSVGYMGNYIRENLSPEPGSYIGARSKRTYVDVSLLRNLLRSNRHRLKIGGGPSLWYQQNALPIEVTSWTKPVGGIDYVEVTRKKQSEFALGVNLHAGYDYSITPRFVLGARVGVLSAISKTESRGAIPNNFLFLGLHLGYQF